MSKISMVYTFPGETDQWSQINITKAYRKAKPLGVDISYIYPRWGDIETAENTYDWQELDENINQIKTAKLKAALAIKIIDNLHFGAVPADVSLNDYPTLMTRFRAFLLLLMDRYKNKIKYLWIGNEIDIYLSNNPAMINPFKTLYAKCYQALKTSYPNVVIGTISTVHDAYNSDNLNIIEDVGKIGDIIGFSFYPQIIPNMEIEELPFCFEIMQTISEKLGKKFAITETSYSSAGYGGSELAQLEYFSSLIQLVSCFEEHIEYVGFFILHDFPDSINNLLGQYYGIEDEEFLLWQKTTGLKYNDGKEKHVYSWLKARYWAKIIKKYRSKR